MPVADDMTTSEWTYSNPVSVTFGFSRFSSIAKVFSAKRAMIITGRAAGKYGLTDRVRKALNVPSEVFDPVEPEPLLSTAVAAARAVADQGCDLVIAIGGGSVMDVAKLAATIKANDDVKPVMLRQAELPARQRRLIVFPTTAGSGSEATPFAVVRDENGMKHSIVSRELYPDIAVVEPSWLTFVPQSVAGAAAMDALAHACEALWSKNANTVSDALAYRALTLFNEALLRYYRDRCDLDAAARMAEGALLAGMAFSNTFTAACHALSYPIGRRYSLAHGAACAQTLPAVALINEPLMRSKYSIALRYIGRGDDFVTFIRALRDEIHTIPALRTFNPTISDFEDIAANAYAPLLANNPVALTRDSIIQLLSEICRSDS